MTDNRKKHHIQTHLKKFVKRNGGILFKKIGIYDLSNTQQNHVKLTEIDDKLVVFASSHQLVVDDIVRFCNRKPDIAGDQSEQTDGVEQGDKFLQRLVVVVVGCVGLEAIQADQQIEIRRMQYILQQEKL
jgi:hypothetical protein